MLYPHIVYKWQMLLPFDVVEDVIPRTSMLQHVILADVIAIGRWNSHYRVVVDYQMIDIITLRCSLNLFPNVLEDSPLYSSSHSTLSHLYLYMTPLFSGWYLGHLELPGGS